VGDRPKLLRVEAPQQGVQAGRRVAALVDLRGIQEPLPDRDLVQRVRLAPGPDASHGPDEVAGGVGIEDHAPSIAATRDT
jgi:hypothetical protein